MRNVSLRSNIRWCSGIWDVLLSQSHHSPIPLVRWLTWPSLFSEIAQVIAAISVCSSAQTTELFVLWFCGEIVRPPQTSSQSRWPTFLWQWTVELLKMSGDEIWQDYSFPHSALTRDFNPNNQVTTYWVPIILLGCALLSDSVSFCQTLKALQIYLPHLHMRWEPWKIQGLNTLLVIKSLPALPPERAVDWCALFQLTNISLLFTIT